MNANAHRAVLLSQSTKKTLDIFFFSQRTEESFTTMLQDHAEQRNDYPLAKRGYFFFFCACLRFVFGSSRLFAIVCGLSAIAYNLVREAPNIQPVHYDTSTRIAKE